MLFPLALFCLASTALCSPGTEVRPEKERVRKEDDVSLVDLQRLVQQQASAINTLQARLTANENQLNSMGSQVQGINTLKARLTATENQLQTTQHKVEVLLKSGETFTQCPDQWVRFEDSCYVFLDDAVPWAIGEMYCRILNDSHLLEVTSQKENDFIVGEMHVKGLTYVWVGVNDLVKEGEWVLNSNHQRATFLPWNKGEPNDAKSHENGEDCVMLYSNGKWNDLMCTDIYDIVYRTTVVCEKPLRT